MQTPTSGTIAARTSPAIPADVHLPTSKVAERYGVVTRTIERWADNPDLNFPEPMRAHKRKYWRLAELEAWERSRAAAAV
jgi:hypothetical protein